MTLHLTCSAARDYLAKRLLMSAKDFISSALPDRSRRNMVACSPGSLDFSLSAATCQSVVGRMMPK
jgi:hypothetical protein